MPGTVPLQNLAQVTTAGSGLGRLRQTLGRDCGGLCREPGPLLSLPDKLVPSSPKGAGQGVRDKPFAQARPLPAPSRPAARALCQLLFPVGQPSREAVQDIVSRERAKQAPLPVADDLPPCPSGPQASLACPALCPRELGPTL